MLQEKILSRLKNLTVRRLVDFVESGPPLLNVDSYQYTMEHICSLVRTLCPNPTHLIYQIQYQAMLSHLNQIKSMNHCR